MPIHFSDPYMRDLEAARSRIENGIHLSLDEHFVQRLLNCDEVRTEFETTGDDRAIALFSRAKALVKQGRHHDGLSAFRTAAGLKPDDPSILYNMGIQELLMGERETGIQTLMQAQRAGHLQAQDVLACLQTGVAITRIDWPVVSTADLVFRHEERGLASLWEGRLLDALVDMNQAIELGPRFGPAYTLRALVRAELKQMDEALADHCQAVALDPNNPNAHYNRGIFRKMQGCFDGAVVDFTSALRLRPGDAEAHNNRGCALMELNLLDEAMADFVAALDLQPGTVPFHMNKAFCHLKRGENSGFKQHVMKGLQLEEVCALRILSEFPCQDWDPTELMEELMSEQQPV